jgi:hypothetical protein
MNYQIRNPHTFDMNNYFTGQVVAVGGKDFEKDDSDSKLVVVTNERKTSYELDWSFLKKNLRTSQKRSK